MLEKIEYVVWLKFTQDINLDTNYVYFTDMTIFVMF